MNINSLQIRSGLIACLMGFIALTTLHAQQGFTYQAVARNTSYEPLRSQDLTLKISIHSGGQNGDLVWQEEHQVRTNPVGIFTLTVGGPEALNPSGSVESFDLIDWSADSYFLNVHVEIDGGFVDMGGSPIQTVPMAQHASTASSATTSFSVQPGSESQPGEALFEVKRKDGQPVFAVYEDMVWVYVDTTATKGKKGGFAVGGYSAAKGVSQEYMRVTPDSIRVYIDTDATAKGKKGGFAVGGYSAAKGPANDLFFNLSPGESADLIPGKSQILFYPAKDAFFAGTIHVGSPDSVGFNSTSLGYKSVAMGQYSQAFGFQSMALGDYSTAIGREAAAMENSFALGNGAVAIGNDSYAFGSAARASGEKSFAFGSVGIDTSGNPTDVPTSATGDYSIAFGMGARALSTGAMSLGASSTSSGYKSIAIGAGTSATGDYATAVGYDTHAEGDKSIAIGAHYNYNLFVYNYKTKTWTLTRKTRENKAMGDYSIAFGNGNYAANGGFALGTYNDANEQGAVALGISNTAQGRYSFSAGYNNDAVGIYATAIGENLYAQSMNSLVIGTFNDTTGSTDDWIDTDPLFQIGNGTRGDERHDAFRVNKNGQAIMNPVNSKYGSYLYHRALSDFGYTTAYGVRANIYKGKDGVTYYSGYFDDDKGTLGTYLGLHADLRSGDGFDVAEYIYDTHGNTGAGDVVVADPDREKSVFKSTAPYQTSVLGVVSTEPHMVMGMDLVVDEETGEPIQGVQATRLALAGRVPVKVTDENGPIRPGDLLTTSSTPGHAMKWSLLDVGKAKDFEELKSILAENERRRNAVIGKAVGSSGSGTGTVMVLISLQ